MKKKIGFLLGCVLTAGTTVFACEDTSIVTINQGISSGAPHYSMASRNLAILEDVEVDIMETEQGEQLAILDEVTEEVTYEKIDAIYRYIRSFDTYDTMLTYSDCRNIHFNDKALDYMEKNWETNYYFEVR